jgi:hypothetical protein
MGYLWLPWVTFGYIGYLGLPALGYLNTYTGCPINIVPLPILGLIIATCFKVQKLANSTPSSALEHSKVCTLCDFGHLQFFIFLFFKAGVRSSR